MMRTRSVGAVGRRAMIAVLNALLGGCDGGEVTSLPGPEAVDPAGARIGEAHGAPAGPGSQLAADPGQVRIQPDAPPPVSGGTLLVLRDGITAVASDPDRDRIHVVELGGLAAPWLRASIPLRRGDEPGRIAEDGAGRAHIALRGGGGAGDHRPGDRRAAPATRRLSGPARRHLGFGCRSDGRRLCRRRAGVPGAGRW